MNSNQKKMLGIAGGIVGVAAVVALIVFLVVVRSNPPQNPFSVQLGQERSVDGIGVTDDGTSFSRAKPLYAFAIYPESGVTKDHTALLSVISESTGRVVQQEKVEEDESLTQVEMTLDCADWEPGIYELTFARSGTMVQSISFSLHK
ncbi:hypothetical protein QWJ34_13625 [Saccharibacillus sp. CPCC 101409]|uniref:hypothetical protein n=1 Tax=Saccharibacillus sp. CPCC 101409 TaxID=3058041 RepID=UPI0026718C44|nr:hypothetical protein [Saccharibacillus sp. CPCC 101409]MDO3410807.1 hypothetical protein [Saccharibacillus sp. CPCC 101409]